MVLLPLLLYAALLQQGGIDAIQGTGNKWYVPDSTVEGGEIQLLRLLSAGQVVIDTKPFTAPVNPVSLDQGEHTIYVHGTGNSDADYRWEVPPGKVFFDVAEVKPPPWNPGIQGAHLDLLVVNASHETVPMLTLVCGGVGPFQRKRVPVWHSMPPLTVARVSVPLVAKESYVPSAQQEDYTLFLSAAGLPGVDPLIQSVRIPHGEPIHELVKPMPKPTRPFQAVVEQYRHNAGYPPATESIKEIGQTEWQGISEWEWNSDQTELKLTPSAKARLVRVSLKKNERLKRISVETEAGSNSWSVVEVGGFGRAFWLEWSAEGWQLHMRGVPAAHKGTHRNGPIASALEDPVWIYGTTGDTVEDELILRWMRKEIGFLLSADPKQKVEMVSDMEFLHPDRAAEFVGRNLIVQGNADTNLAWSKLAASDIPLNFDRRGMTVSGKLHPGSDFVGFLLQPRPLDTGAKVIFCGRSGDGSAFTTRSLTGTAMGNLDFVMMGGGLPEIEGDNFGEFRNRDQYGRFDHRWRFPEQPDLAEQE